jgi:putative Mg2+ transporter-C (MgtC) family protein
MTRVIQGLIAGVGFLGAGSIIKGRGEEEIKGLTTAASIWLTAAVGVSVGMGREATAVLSTLLAVAILSTIPKVVRHFDNRRS